MRLNSGRRSGKSWVPAVLAVLLMLPGAALSSCASAGGPAKPGEMSIRTAELTREEENLLKLTQFGGNVRIYDYTVDDSIHSAAVSSYKLNENLSWEENGGVFSEINSRTGRIAVGTEGRKLKVSCQDAGGATSYTFGGMDAEGAAADRTFAVSWNDASEITAEQELPLAVRIVTGSGEIHSFGPESFFDTEQLKGYDEVTAIVITFSTHGLETGKEEPLEEPVEEPVEEPMEEPVDPFARTDSYTARFEIFDVDEHGILAGGLGRESGLYHVGHGSYLRDSDGGKLSASDLKPGMIVELNWNGMVQESYPGQFSYDGLKVTGETGSRSFSLYTQILQDLAEVDPDLNEDIGSCYVDLSMVPSLTALEKEGLAYLCGSYYGVMGEQQTEEALVQSGVLDPEKGLEHGLLVTVEETSAKGDTLVCSARKYRSGTGAYYFSNITAVYEDGRWSYQIGAGAMTGKSA